MGACVVVESECPVWEGFVGKLCGDRACDLANLRMFCGYVLADHCRYERFLALCGDADATGAVFRVMAMAAGEDNVIEIDVTSFSCFGRMAFRTAWLARHRGELSADCDDLDQFLKLVTGDRMAAETKRVPRKRFHSRTKVVCCLDEPHANRNASFARRMLTVNLPASLPEDFEIPLHYRFQEEKEGIQKWMERGLEMLTEQGGFGCAIN